MSELGAGRKIFVVITQHVISDGHGHEFVYHSDGRYFASRAGASRYGWRVCESDDFNIGTIVDGRLVAFGWGDWDFGDPSHEDEDGLPHGGYDLLEIQRQALAGFPWSRP